MAAAVCALAGASSPAAAQPPPVSVFPIPGGRVAAPGTQITFRGVPATALTGITVTGSSSGRHAGTIAADSDGRGGSFLPSTRFQPGETVTVKTPLGVLGGKGGTFSFQIATSPGPVPYQAAQFVPRVPGDIWRFRSRGDLAPAAVQMLKNSSAADPEDIFLAPKYGPLQNGPEILDPSGNLVWFYRLPHGDSAADFRVQQYRGQPVLTWWEGYTVAGIGVGQDVIYDASYSPVVAVRAGNGLSADLHEFQLTPSGTALITAYYPVYWDASAIRGGLKREITLDAVVQEIDIRTGLVLFQWDSLDHVPVTDSYEALPKQSAKSSSPFDYIHVNSVQLDDDGNLLISARNTWAAYKVSHQTGAMMWTLGGRRSSFTMGRGTGFAFQHDVRARAQNDQYVTVFDDGAGPPNVHSQSRGLKLLLDLKHMTATAVTQVEHAPPLLTTFEGNYQQLHDGDNLIGWGQQPYFTEYDSRGRPVADGRYVDGTSSYRVYKFAWQGQPKKPPDVAASTSGKTTTVYVSWNGATKAGGWRVLSGPSPTSLKPTRAGAKRGFETAFAITAAPYVAVQALDFSGRVIATSAPVSAG